MTVTLRVNRLWLGLGAALVAAGVWWLRTRASYHDYTNLPPTASGPWVAFGDSLTEGVGASPGQDYPSLLARRLNVPIVNLGRAGDTTADGLDRLDQVLRLQPRVVFLCLGGNDGLQRRPAAETLANLGTIIDRLQAQGSFVVLIGVRSASLLDKNDKPFRRLARQKRVFYVPDILAGVFPNPAYMADAVHPNDAGYQRIAERLDRALRPLWPQLMAPSPRPPAQPNAPVP